MRKSEFLKRCFLYILVFAHWEIHSSPLQQIMRARSSGEIRTLTSHQQQLTEMRTACRIQVRAKLFPVACYHALQLESRPAREQIRILRKLDDLCARAAKSHLLNMPPTSFSMSQVQSAQVSRFCQQQILTAQRVQDYRDTGSQE